MSKPINIKLETAKKFIIDYDFTDEFAEQIHNNHERCGDEQCIDPGGGIWDEVEYALETLKISTNDTYESEIYTTLDEQDYQWNKDKAKWLKKPLPIKDSIIKTFLGGR